MFEVTKVDLKECNLREALTLCAYLIINTDFSDKVYIDECIDKCTWKLNGFLCEKNDLVSEYFYLLDIIKKRKKRLPKNDENRVYLKNIENKFNEVIILHGKKKLKRNLLIQK